ncbi:hypothetical protein [Bifidobacterium phasiani]|uniref:Alpha-L-arabinofuranosidase n=1 Tax=Bifidobacterium phasiani TaxID=2834431 RepID=A0ABS6W9F5_9BIFI|nr:hypothetical protein [Bifidobacterium phasiani]MBW3083133.1 hypothetical protein [Bifidobacterium phasiani]
MMLHDDDPHRRNTAEQPDAVVPTGLEVGLNAGTLTFSLPAVAWSAVRFRA